MERKRYEYEEKNKELLNKEHLTDKEREDLGYASNQYQEELQKEIFAISEKVYKAAAEAQAAAGGNPADANAQPEDNVYEADFTDVDENK